MTVLRHIYVPQSLASDILIMFLFHLLLKVLPGKDWCRFLMGVWVWLRAANVWSTLFLSAFHFYTLKRIGPPTASLNPSRGPPKALLMCFGLIWTLNLLYSVPAFVYSTNGSKNASEVREGKKQHAVYLCSTMSTFTFTLSNVGCHCPHDIKIKYYSLS